MRLLPVIVAVLFIVLHGGEGFILERLFGTTPQRSVTVPVARRASPRVSELGVAALFLASYLKRARNLEAGSSYGVAKFYRNEVIDLSWKGLTVIHADLLLRRTLTSSSKAYPFEYLYCTDVELQKRRKSIRKYILKGRSAYVLVSHKCQDLEDVRGVDKEVVAQAAREYAWQISGGKFFVFRVPKVEVGDFRESVVKAQEKPVSRSATSSSVYNGQQNGVNSSVNRGNSSTNGVNSAVSSGNSSINGFKSAVSKGNSPVNSGQTSVGGRNTGNKYGSGRSNSGNTFSGSQSNGRNSGSRKNVGPTQTNVTLTLHIQMVERKGLSKREHLSIMDCSGVVVNYNGNAQQFRSSHVTVKNPGTCRTVVIPTVNKKRTI